MTADADAPSQSRAPLGVTEVVAQRIILRDMVVACTIGFLAEERARRQRLRISVELLVRPSPPEHDDISETLNYSQVVRRVRALCQACPHKLLESLAEDLAAACFEYDPVLGTRVKIEKLDRYPDLAGIGIEIERRRKS